VGLIARFKEEEKKIILKDNDFGELVKTWRGQNPSQRNEPYIRYRIRLLLSLRERVGGSSLFKCLSRTNVEKIKEAVLFICGGQISCDDDPEAKGLQKPYIFPKLLGILQDAYNCITRITYEKGESAEDVTSSQSVVMDHLKKSLGRLGRYGKMQLCREAEGKLPEQKDIARLNKQLNRKLKSAIRKFEDKNCYIHFREVQEILLSFITIHNGRRQCEVSRITKRIYQGMITKENCRRGAMTTAERIQLEKYSCVRVTSKNFSSVNILLTNVMVAAMHLVYKNMERYLDASIFLFGLRKKPSKTMECHRVLRRLVQEIGGFVKPDLLVAGKVRIFLCTEAQQLQNSDADMEKITSHFGHSKKVHMTVYRKNLPEVAIGQVSQLLEAINTDQMKKNRKSQLGGLILSGK